MTPRGRAALACLIAWLALAPRAAAHRLDEYLQATRVSVDAERIRLEIDLTPGVNVAPNVLAALDSDRDGEISDQEGHAYAGQVIGSLTLSVDDRRASLTLVGREFPTPADINLGVGTIRLAAAASVPPADGVRRLTYVNGFLPESSVYLANALVPLDERVEVGRLSRDPLQRSLLVEYRVTPGHGHSRLLWSIAALGMIGALVIARTGVGARLRT